MKQLDTQRFLRGTPILLIVAGFSLLTSQAAAKSKAHARTFLPPAEKLRVASPYSPNVYSVTPDFSDDSAAEMPLTAKDFSFPESAPSFQQKEEVKAQQLAEPESVEAIEVRSRASNRLLETLQPSTKAKEVAVEIDVNAFAPSMGSVVSLPKTETVVSGVSEPRPAPQSGLIRFSENVSIKQSNFATFLGRQGKSSKPVVQGDPHVPSKRRLSDAYNAPVMDTSLERSARDGFLEKPLEPNF